VDDGVDAALKGLRQGLETTYVTADDGTRGVRSHFCQGIFAKAEAVEQPHLVALIQ
jgi:hypothetical protein